MRRKVDGRGSEPFPGERAQQPKGIHGEVRGSAQDVLARQHRKFLEALEGPDVSQQQQTGGRRELAERCLK